jgi:hypothetical protein
VGRLAAVVPEVGAADAAEHDPHDGRSGHWARDHSTEIRRDAGRFNPGVGISLAHWARTQVARPRFQTMQWQYAAKLGGETRKPRDDRHPSSARRGLSRVSLPIVVVLAASIGGGNGFAAAPSLLKKRMNSVGTRLDSPGFPDHGRAWSAPCMVSATVHGQRPQSGVATGSSPSAAGRMGTVRPRRAA